MKWLAIAMIFWVLSYLISEVEKDKYTEIKTSCAKGELMHEECKKIMLDKEVTNFEYIIFKYDLSEKERKLAASNVLK